MEKNKQDNSLKGGDKAGDTVSDMTKKIVQEREDELRDLTEELSSQKEMLTAAIEELVNKNASLESTLRKLQERSFELDQILYRTSHDLRSPLTSIQGILSLLKLEPQSAMITRYGQHIENSTVQMDSLLQSLSSLSKALLENPVMEMVNVANIVSKVREACKFLPASSRMKVHMNLQNVTVKSDGVLMKIIIQALLTNAFIFRDPNREGNVYIEFLQKENEFEIVVSDDGEGIDPLVLPRIFDMFFRGSERSLGNGLGLYIARKAVEQLGGHLSVRCTSGMTLFSINLPVNP